MKGVAAHDAESGAKPEASGAQNPGFNPDVSRRHFLHYALGLSGVLGLAGLLAPILRYAYPTVMADASAVAMVATKAELVQAGGELDIEYQEVPAALVILDDGSVMGLSRICTHLGCVISWRAEDRLFACPCHAGFFSPDGEVIGGPPPRPLSQLVVVEKGDELWIEGWQPES